MDSARKLIGLGPDDRDWLRRYYGRLTELEVDMLHEQQTRVMRGWIDARHPAAEEPVGKRSKMALLVVLDRHRRASKATGRKSRGVTPEEMDQVENARIAGALAGKPRRVPRKKQLLARRWLPVVLRLRGEGMSWQGVEKYLRKYHRYSASYDYIRRACADIVSDREKRGEDMTAAKTALRFQQPRGTEEGGDT